MEAFLEAFPYVGLLLASTLVLLAAEIVKSATQWVKTRLKQRLRDVPHAVTHLVSFTFSLALGFAFLHDGRLTDDPVLGALSWPWNVLIFSVAVFLRAGGVFDTQRENTQGLARHRQ